MPQTPLNNIAIKGKTRVPLLVDAVGNLMVVVQNADPTVATKDLAVTQARQLDVGEGTLESAFNLGVTALTALTVTQLASLTTTSVGSFYDVAAATQAGVLTTTQLATLGQTQLMALLPQSLLKLQADLPYAHGLVYVPGSNVGLGAPVVTIVRRSDD